MDAVEVPGLGPYTLIAPLAHGGMGSVYFAVRSDAPPPRSLVLVKTLKPGLVGVEDYAGRFHDEAKVALRLRHKNLCEVFEAGIDEGNYWLAMELIEGVTLRRLMSLMKAKKQRLRPVEAAALTVSMLRGLHAAHVATDEQGRPLGVVHRDVSPHNAMLDVHGRVKVIDYGLATSVLKETFTESMVALGKSGYMPPEQARGEDVTPAGDQYSAAIVLYELFTGDRFYGDLNSRAIWAVAGSGAHKPRAWHKVPEPFRAVLQRALSPKADERFESCAAFADALVAVDKRAADSEEMHGLCTVVHELAPEELAAVEAARVALVQLEDVTEKAPILRTLEATQVVRSRAPVDETASTLLRPRALAVPPRRSRAPLVAALAGVAAVAAGATLLVVPALHAPPPARAAVAPAASPAPPSPGGAAPPAAAVVAAAFAPAASVAAPTPRPPRAPGGTPHAAQGAGAAKRADAGRRVKLGRRADAALARLSPSCPLVLVVKNARAHLDEADLDTFEGTLDEAERECSPR